MKAARLAALAVGLTYASHVAATVGITWATMRKYRGRGMAGERVRDHLPPYVYPRRRIGPSLVVIKDLDTEIVPGDRAVPPGPLVFERPRYVVQARSVKGGMAPIIRPS